MESIKIDLLKEKENKYTKIKSIELYPKYTETFVEPEREYPREEVSLWKT